MDVVYSTLPSIVMEPPFVLGVFDGGSPVITVPNEYDVVLYWVVVVDPSLMIEIPIYGDGAEKDVNWVVAYYVVGVDTIRDAGSGVAFLVIHLDVDFADVLFGDGVPLYMQQNDVDCVEAT